MKRPKLSIIEFTFSCHAPKNYSIFPISDKKELQPHDKFVSHEQIYAVPQKKDILYYIRTGSSQEVRVYGFDYKKRMIVNYSQNVGDFEERKLFVSTKQDYKGEFVKFNFDFSKQKGEELANYSNLHSARFNLIDFPEIFPKYKTLYLHKDNKFIFKIANGSGNFKLIGSSEVASIALNERDITVTPKERGKLTFSIEDNSISLNFEVQATVFVSPINIIKLSGGGLVPIGVAKKMTCDLIAFDDNKFDHDQITLMNIEIKQFSLLDQSPIAKSSKHSFEFSLTGHEANIYPISVTELDSKVRSNIQNLEVFVNLDVFPDYLLMTPGMTHSILIRGGPKSEHKVIKKVHIIDTGIAVLHQEDIVVEAKHLGLTTAVIKLYYEEENDDSLLCEKEIPVEVRIPDSVAIRYVHKRQVFFGSTVKLLAGLKYQNRYFVYGSIIANYEWTKDLDHVIEFKRSSSCEDSHSVCVPQLNSNSVGVFVKSNGVGVAEVSLRINITYPNDYYYSKSFFQTSERIGVETRLQIDINDYYDSKKELTSFYLLPPNTEHDLEITNTDSVNY